MTQDYYNTKHSVKPAKPHQALAQGPMWVDCTQYYADNAEESECILHINSSQSSSRFLQHCSKDLCAAGSCTCHGRIQAEVLRGADLLLASTWRICLVTFC